MLLTLLAPFALAGAPQLPDATWLEHDDTLLCVSGVPDGKSMRGKDRAVVAPLFATLAASDDPVASWQASAAQRASLKDHPALASAELALRVLGSDPDAAIALSSLANAHPGDACLHATAAVAAQQAGDDSRYHGHLGKAWITGPGPETAALMAEALLDQREATRAMAVLAQGLRLRPDDVRLRGLRIKAALQGGGRGLLVDVLEDLEVLWASGDTSVGPTLRDARYQAGQIDAYLRVASTLDAPLAGLDLSSSEAPLSDLRAHLGVGPQQTLVATLHTSEGEIDCALFVDEAPVTVAAFVGLSRGDQPWTDPTTGRPGEGPLYPGTRFHRVIPDFMIQGGDPLGSGVGGPGYRFHDEIHPSLHFDSPGRLAMANAGPGTNGSQFFITSAPTAHLEGRHTIFGQCSPLRTVREIAAVPRDSSDVPDVDVLLEAITIEAR